MKHKFLSFLDKLGGDKLLVESIKQGFIAIYESDDNIQSSPQFDFKTLESLSSFNKRIAYCKQFFPQVGKGSGRVVFELDDDTVLKLAFNPKGVHQNDVESDYYIQQSYGDILAKVLKVGQDNSYLVSEKANKITPSEFKQATGIPFKDFANALHQEYMYSVSRNPRQVMKDENNGVFGGIEPKLQYVINNEFFQEIIDMSHNYEMPSGDFERIGSYGKTPTKNVVVRDYGLTTDVLNTSYNRKASPRINRWNWKNE